MVYHEDSSSGEFQESYQQPHQHGRQPHHRPLASGSGSSSRCSADTENSYEDVYSSSSEDEDYHSDCDDLAEYWDPYCENN